MGFAGPGTMPFVAYNQDFSRILAIAGNGGAERRAQWPEAPAERQRAIVLEVRRVEQAAPD